MPKNTGNLRLNRSHLLSASQRILPHSILAGRLIRSIKNSRDSMLDSDTDALIRLLVTSREFAELSDLIKTISTRKKERLNFNEKEERIEAMADWLEAHGEINGFELAIPLSDFSITSWDLEMLYQICGSQHMEVILRWFHHKLELNIVNQSFRLINSDSLDRLVWAFKRVSFS